MKYICFAGEPADANRFGNKGLRLARLARSGFNVPDFFVVTPEAFSTNNIQCEIADAMQHICPDGTLVAVRSSSLEEDGGQSSFAGQLDSFLNVSGKDIAMRVADVWRSAFSERIRSYRQSQGLEGDISAPAVVVQRMVDAEVSGVAFAADPVTGDRDVAVVAATSGTW
uniref:pyruvate, water dikinase n=1 Tax=uncultured marine microorganism TaxID=415540 RepID=A5CFS0_9ZZZZ|nr:phosphoenolpyruvate synthase/pyruvate phosphate dikinase [uncultured marine microorganism]